MEGNLYKVEVIAALLKKSVRRIQQLTQDGVISTVEITGEQGRTAKRYDLVPTVQKYVAHIEAKAYQKERNRSDKDNESAKLEADARLKQAKAEIAELELSELKGEMHRAEDVEAITTNIVFAVRSFLLAMPNRLAVDVNNAKSKAEASEIIRREIHNVLVELAKLDYNKTDYKKLVRERKGLGYEDEETQTYKGD